MSVEKNSVMVTVCWHEVCHAKPCSWQTPAFLNSSWFELLIIGFWLRKSFACKTFNMSLSTSKTIKISLLYFLVTLKQSDEFKCMECFRKHLKGQVTFEQTEGKGQTIHACYFVKRTKHKWFLLFDIQCSLQCSMGGT